MLWIATDLSESAVAGPVGVFMTEGDAKHWLLLNRNVRLSDWVMTRVAWGEVPAAWDRFMDRRYVLHSRDIS